MNNQVLHSKVFKWFLTAVLSVLVICSCSSAVFAEEVPYDTYTYWYGVKTNEKDKVVSATPMYQLKTVVSATSLGIESLQSVSDIFVDDDGDLYILDGDASKLVITDSNYTVKSIITKINKNEEMLDFAGAKSVYVKGDTVYICDTENARVLLTDISGNYIDELLLSDSPIIPEGFLFRPVKVAVDQLGYVYILSEGSYYGALLYDSEKNFVGFYGANTVTTGVLDAISEAFQRAFMNNAKKSATARNLPYAFADICIDDEGFVYTVTGYTEQLQKGQIKKLSPGDATNILNSNGVSFTDSTVNQTKDLGKVFNQSLIGIDVDDYGFIYALDSTYGRVFIYDEKCTVLTAFGGGMKEGKQDGTFVSPTGISVFGKKIYVSDTSKQTVTVFEETEFGALVKKARNLNMQGDHLAAEADWRTVLSVDKNCQMAYTGIALARLADGDYDNALKYAKQGYDRETYSLAFEEVRTKWLNDNFWLIATLVIVLAAAIVFVVIYKKKKHIVWLKNEKLKMLFRAPFHPVQTFGEIQSKKLGSWTICVALAIIYYVVSVLRVLLGGFASTFYDAESFNSIIVFVRSTGLIVLWVVVNWAVSTLFSGRGKIKEIATVTCYSLLPLIVGEIANIIFSNILTPEESAFVSIFYTVMMLYTLVLIMVGTIVIHEFDFKRFILTTLLTLLGIAIVVFIIILVFLLAQQFLTFLISVYSELTM